MMSRLSFISALFGFRLFAQLGSIPGHYPQPKLRKYYVTGGYRLDPTQNDCSVSPLICYGSDRIDALTNSGITIWEAEEFEAFAGKNNEKWLALCRQQKVGSR